MAKKNKFTKFIIIFILAFFVAVTGLSMIVPYIGGNGTTQETGDILTGDISIETGTVVAETGIFNTENADTGLNNIKTVEVGTVSPIIANTGAK